MSAVRPKPFGKSTLAPCFSSSLTIPRWLLAAAACSRPNVEGRPPLLGAEQRALTSPPLHRSHLTTFCNSPRSADQRISSGSGAGELSAGSPASGGAAGEAAAGCGGAACCQMRATMAVCPWALANCRAVSPSSSTSS
eukprot:scaffold88479_cov51-Phaeocystis_antarctica.AAC.1